MGDVVCAACTVIQATCLLNTVLSVNFDIRLVSFDLELVDNRNKVGQGSALLHTKDNRPNLRRPDKPKKHLHRADHPAERDLRQAQPTTLPDSVDLQSDSGPESQSDNEHDSLSEAITEPQLESQPNSEADPQANPDSNPGRQLDQQSGRHQFSPPPSTICYGLPEKTQVEFILSSIKHELTQVFIKTNEWLRTRLSKKIRKLRNSTSLSRLLDRRLNVTLEKRVQYIENAQQQMISDYTKSYNEIKTSHFKPCLESNVVEELWQKVLNHSSLTIKKTIHECVERYLADMNISQRSALGARVRKHILDNMKNIKQLLLKQLCDKYQLCPHSSL